MAIEVNKMETTESEKKDFTETKHKVNRDDRKLDKLADRIIKAFIVNAKRRNGRIVDQIDNISYEESENRLMIMGVSLAMVQALVATILTIVALIGNQNNSSNHLLPNNTKLNYLIPCVTFMGVDGEGHMLTIKQNQNMTFQYAWKFKLPKVPNKTGYFAFEDQQSVFVIPSSKNQKITMINNPENHVTLSKSQIIGTFYYTGSILRVGNFVMVWGGINNENALLSAFFGDVTSCTSTIAIWSTKRQLWMTGPSLPNIKDCISVSSGFAVNKTIGVILQAPRIESDKGAVLNGWNRCIHAYTYSFDTFEWVDLNECLINTTKAIEKHTFITCATYFDRSYQL